MFKSEDSASSTSYEIFSEYFDGLPANGSPLKNGDVLSSKFGNGKEVWIRKREEPNPNFEYDGHPLVVSYDVSFNPTFRPFLSSKTDLRTLLTQRVKMAGIAFNLPEHMKTQSGTGTKIFSTPTWTYRYEPKELPPCDSDSDESDEEEETYSRPRFYMKYHLIKSCFTQTKTSPIEYRLAYLHEIVEEMKTRWNLSFWLTDALEITKNDVISRKLCSCIFPEKADYSLELLMADLIDFTAFDLNVMDYLKMTAEVKDAISVSKRRISTTEVEIAVIEPTLVTPDQEKNFSSVLFERLVKKVTCDTSCHSNLVKDLPFLLKKTTFKGHSTLIEHVLQEFSTLLWKFPSCHDWLNLLKKFSFQDLFSDSETAISLRNYLAREFQILLLFNAPEQIGQFLKKFRKLKKKDTSRKLDPVVAELKPRLEPS